MAAENPSYWFVGASYGGGTDDQTPRFLKKGIWENGSKEKHLDVARAMQPGERIAIKAVYTQKHDLPFDNRGLTVSVMAIKAVGTITANPGDGRRVQVDWTPVDPPKLWYFYTNLPTIWRVQRNKWAAEALIDFTFEGATQDIDRFRNDSYWAERFGDVPPESNDNDKIAGGSATKSEEVTEKYSIDNILADGCFIDRAELERFIDRLRIKKNLILQGPPGTGKTWLAKRLAFALIGQRDHRKLRAVQFHPNLSYEDFVRGWRPSGDGKLSLVDGAFMEAVEAARGTSQPYVVVIEEINRGNPAQIFGEMLTLLEADKRSPHEALELCYRRKSDERIYIPDNLYVLGTMNIADRSLALVDLALRRRFAFVDLEPQLGQSWRDWLINRCGIAVDVVGEIQLRIAKLNEEISADSTLGRQFRIGHSYVTPRIGMISGDALEWFRQVVATEIGPLLDEYWFDALDKARGAQQRLIEGL